MKILKTLTLQSQENFLSLFRKSEKGESDEKCSNQILNPIRLFSLLSSVDCFTFFSAYFCVTIDFMEYSTVAVESVELSKRFQTSNAAISTGLMLSMISGVFGAIIFGLLGDCGRKTPLVINCVYLTIMQILITQCISINQFLLVKTMSGLGIGGLFGNALQSVLDRVPTEAKGLMAGILWSAGDFGVFLTSAIKLALNKTKQEHDWTLIFWISAALSFAAAIVRICVPESPQFRRENLKIEEGQTTIQRAKKRIQDTKMELNIFITNLRQLFKTQWMTFIYLTIFVCLLSSIASIYETTYPTFLEEGKRFDKESIPKTIMIVSLGGFIGSCSGAGFSQSTGRRICVIFASFIALCLIPAYILPTKPLPLSVGGFFFVMISNMANSVTSIHISELSSPAFRSVMSGSAYQLGQTLSSPAGVMVNALATFFQTQKQDQEMASKAYVPVIGITMVIFYVLIIILTAIGPEKHAAQFVNFIPANKEVLKTCESDDSSSTNVSKTESFA